MGFFYAGATAALGDIVQFGGERWTLKAIAYDPGVFLDATCRAVRMEFLGLSLNCTSHVALFGPSWEGIELVCRSMGPADPNGPRPPFAVYYPGEPVLVGDLVQFGGQQVSRISKIYGRGWDPIATPSHWRHGTYWYGAPGLLLNDLNLDDQYTANWEDMQLLRHAPRTDAAAPSAKSPRARL